MSHPLEVLRAYNASHDAIVGVPKDYAVTITSNRIRCRLIRHRIDTLLHTNPWEAK